MSNIFSKFNRFLWLILPPLFFYIFAYSLYQFDTVKFDSLLTHMHWLSYVGLGISAAIAMQFGRSRLVYSCFLLLLYTPFIDSFTVQYLEFETIRFCFVLLTACYLLFTKDKGFSPLNVLFSLGIIALLALSCHYLLIEITQLSQPYLGKLDSILLQVSPKLREIITPFELVLLFSVFVISLFRLVWQSDNTHNALFFILIISAFLYFSADKILSQLSLLFLSALVCYSVIKDSFTMAFKDELTEIPSRRALMQYVQTLGRKYTVVMSDIDHFKKFNDTYGHDVGDEVLKLVASKLNKVTGGGKTFRFGGEEFVIIFPRKNANEVVPFVELVRQVIADYDIALRTKPRPPKPPKGSTTTNKKPSKEKIVKVTTSFGVANRTKDAADFSQVMKQADIALYAAKKGGRNCVKVAKQ